MIAKRLNIYIKYKKLSINSFEIAINVSSSSISKYIRGEGKGIGSIHLEKILNAFPDLSAEWLLRGEGEMIKPTHTVPSSEINHLAIKCIIDQIAEKDGELKRRDEEIKTLLGMLEKLTAGIDVDKIKLPKTHS